MVTVHKPVNVLSSDTMRGMNGYDKYLQIKIKLSRACESLQPVTLTADEVDLLHTILYKSNTEEFASNYLDD